MRKIRFGGAGMAKGKRAEPRCRYLVRDIAGQKGWDVRQPQKLICSVADFSMEEWQYKKD
jgi:hypothetical protein